MIYLNRISVAANAPRGTIVGIISVYDTPARMVPCNLQLTSDSRGFFTIVNGNSLVTAWEGPPVRSGLYPITIQANGVGFAFTEVAELMIQVT